MYIVSVIELNFLTHVFGSVWTRLLIHILPINNSKGQQKQQLLSNKHYPESFLPNVMGYVFHQSVLVHLLQKKHFNLLWFSFGGFLPARSNPFVLLPVVGFST